MSVFLGGLCIGFSGFRGGSLGYGTPELLEPLERSARMNGSSILTDGPVAQLGARLNGIQEVTGSIPVRSTKPSFPVLISRK